jgi:hypothetical protein
MQDIIELKSLETMGQILSVGFWIRSIGGAILNINCIVIAADSQKADNK